MMASEAAEYAAQMATAAADIYSSMAFDDIPRPPDDPGLRFAQWCESEARRAAGFVR